MIAFFILFAAIFGSGYYLGWQGHKDDEEQREFLKRFDAAIEKHAQPPSPHSDHK